MSPFQIAALLFLAVVFVATVAAAVKGAVARRDGFIWAVIWIIAAVAIAFPELTTLVANALGIGRGANLVLYCSVVLMLVGFLMVYARLRRLRHEVTLLVRRLAIRDAMEAPRVAEDDPGTEKRDD